MPVRRALRITFIGRYVGGTTGIIRSLFLGLHEQGHLVQEVDVGRRRGLLRPPAGPSGDAEPRPGPLQVRLDRLAGEIISFRPDLILLAGTGLTFSRRDMVALQRSAAVVGMTMDDPHAYPVVSTYARRFTLHTTNSAEAQRRYKEEGIAAVLMPYAVDSRFFVPLPGWTRHRAQVAVLGHATPYRIRVGRGLADRYLARFHGRGWPYHTGGPIRGQEWFRAIQSAPFLVYLPPSEDGMARVPAAVFEGTAAGRLVFAPYMEELRRYYQYGEEIVGYDHEDDLVRKIGFYLEHPAQAAAMAKAGQRRCARDHTWNSRIDDLVAALDWPPASRRPWPSVGSGPALRVLRRRPTRLSREAPGEGGPLEGSGGDASPVEPGLGVQRPQSGGPDVGSMGPPAPAGGSQRRPPSFGTGPSPGEEKPPSDSSRSSRAGKKKKGRRRPHPGAPKRHRRPTRGSSAGSRRRPRSPRSRRVQGLRRTAPRTHRAGRLGGRRHG